MLLRSGRSACRSRSGGYACSRLGKLVGTCRLAAPPAAGVPEAHAIAKVSVRYAAAIGRAPNTALQQTAFRRANARDFTTPYSRQAAAERQAVGPPSARNAVGEGIASGGVVSRCRQHKATRWYNR
jgi:hypothetical protein